MTVNRSVKLKEHQWKNLKERLKKDYPLSTIIIRDKMRCVLGFTVREDRYDYWNPTIHLDFFDEKKKTMFLLKYSDFINVYQKEKV